MPFKNPHPLFSTWAHIKSRAKYGQFKMCESWNSFSCFLADVGQPPAAGMRLIRKDRAVGYSPENVVWALEAQKYTARTDYRIAVGHPLYSVWRSMLSRCYDKSASAYKDYGGRGIAVCDSWRDSFHAFVDDMGERPAKTTIERKNNDGNYEPANCKWATRKEQQRNRRVTRLVKIGRLTFRAVDLAEHTGLKADTIIARAESGLSLDAVLSTKRRLVTSGLAMGGAASGARQRSKTHCPHGHAYDEANTYYTQEGWRNCRKCKAIKQVARTARKALARGAS